MKEQRHISLLGAILIAAAVIALKHWLELPDENDPKITGIREREILF